MLPRSSFVEELARLLPAPAPGTAYTFIAIDGVDGAGKTTLADNLAEIMRPARAVVRISIDGFHRSRAARHARGRDSPEGFWLDSYDYAAFWREVVVPFRSGTGTYLAAVHDVDSDALVSAPRLPVIAGATVIIDGIFLHRDELRDVWDTTVFLDVPATGSVRRLALRDGSSPDPLDTSQRRYVKGQRLYLTSCSPRERASILVDYSDIGAASIVRGSRGADRVGPLTSWRASAPGQSAERRRSEHRPRR